MIPSHDKTAIETWLAWFAATSLPSAGPSCGERTGSRPTTGSRPVLPYMSLPLRLALQLLHSLIRREGFHLGQ